MNPRPDDLRTAALLRSALDEHLEAVMSITDTERELSRFRTGVRRRSARGRWTAAAAAAVVLAAAAAGALALRDDGTGASLAGSSDELSGRLVLEVDAFRNVELGRSDQTENRDVVLVGTAEVDAGGLRTGTARLVGGASTVSVASYPAVVHAWGQAEVVLDGTRCTGAFAYAYYHDPRESGGSLNLTCEDGAVLGTGLVVEQTIGSDQELRWRATLSFVDGSYVGG